MQGRNERQLSHHHFIVRASLDSGLGCEGRGLVISFVALLRLNEPPLGPLQGPEGQGWADEHHQVASSRPSHLSLV
jgi:hypothetical protein